jgi:UDP-2,3-diacylglucosamine hydrolase
MKKLGIIAAKGDLSKRIVEYALGNNIDCFVLGLENESDPKLVGKADHIWVKLGQVSKAVEAMKKAGVSHIVFVGSLKKPDLFSLKLDMLGIKMLARITKDKFLGDNNLLSSITRFFEEYGFKVIGAHEILKDIVVEEGIYTKTSPNKQDKIDIELGMKAVASLGSLDIGQAVITQTGVVLGVEAIEGTDKLIERCASVKISQKHAGVLVKLSKPKQELRMDLPTIGIKTIKNMHKAGFKGILIEAKKAIFLDQEKVIAYANKHNIFVMAVSVPAS